MIPGIILVGIILLLFGFQANAYNKRKNAIEKHKENGDIHPDVN